MKNSLIDNYNRIEESINFIRENLDSKIDLNQLAQKVDLSSDYFQKIFSKFVGISPQRYQNYLKTQKAKRYLISNTVEETTFTAGFSSTGRLYDAMINFESVTPGEYKSMDELTIIYGFINSPFGRILIAETARGICELSFVQSSTEKSIYELKQKWPGSDLVEDDEINSKYSKIFTETKKNIQKPLSLFVKGTNFQVKVWEALMRLNIGQTKSYGEIAKSINNPKASRAVGTAIGKNNIALLIPCHRVLASDGSLGGYRWGVNIKKKILQTENRDNN